jgi:capsule polysaccharide export protein KpsE/RkpR
MPVESPTIATIAEQDFNAPVAHPPSSAAMPNWLLNIHVLWNQRALLRRLAAASFVVSLLIALLIPKMYESQTRIMPPETSDTNSTLLGMFAGRLLGNDSLGNLATSLIGGHTNSALFVDLLRSSSVTDPLIEKFELQHVYYKRYRVDAAKVLARRTTIAQDKKSGVITLSVRDTDPRRARDLAQAYLDQLNTLVNRTSTSPAHQEKLFIEQRVQEVKRDLDHAQDAMSEFSSTHATIDLKEQTRATVESQAMLEGELIAAESELQSLQQLYGDSNIRVRSVEAKIASLKRELGKLEGTSAPLPTAAESIASPAPAADKSYLPLRQVPRLAIPYANLYRELHVQETLYDLLTQQYEVARIQEAKDVPAVNVIDAPGIPEKKSFPPRTLLTLALTLVLFSACSLYLVCRHHWLLIDPGDPRRSLGREMFDSAVSVWPASWRRKAL